MPSEAAEVIVTALAELPAHALAQIQFIAGDSPSSALARQLRRVCPNLVMLSLIPCAWPLRGSTQLGKNAHLAAVLSKLSVRDPQLPPELTPREQAQRDHIKDPSHYG